MTIVPCFRPMMRRAAGPKRARRATADSGERMPRRKEPNFIPKPFELRLWEFIDSLCIVRDALQGVRTGKQHQLRVIAGQLRLLLTDRSKGTEPLLVEIARRADIPLAVYHNRGVGVPGGGQSQLLFALGGFPISVKRMEAGQVEGDLQTLLEVLVLRLQDTTYSVREIIDLYANSAGGAHSPPNWPADVVDLSGVVVMGMHPLSQTIYQLGEAVLRLGAALLNELGSFEWHVAMAWKHRKGQSAESLLSLAFDEGPAEVRVVGN